MSIKQVVNMAYNTRHKLHCKCLMQWPATQGRTQRSSGRNMTLACVIAHRLDKFGRFLCSLSLSRYSWRVISITSEQINVSSVYKYHQFNKRINSAARYSWTLVCSLSFKVGRKERKRGEEQDRGRRGRGGRGGGRNIKGRKKEVLVSP